MTKIEKKAEAEIMAFYTGGAKVHASTTHTKEELEKLVEIGMVEGFAMLNTVNEDPTIEDDSLFLLFDKMLFCTIIRKAEKSSLILPDKKIAVVGGA